MKSLSMNAEVGGKDGFKRILDLIWTELNILETYATHQLFQAATDVKILKYFTILKHGLDFWPPRAVFTTLHFLRNLQVTLIS